MHSRKRVAAILAILCAGAMGVTACGQWQPPLPSGPSGFGDAPASGAIVTGTVNGGARGVNSLTAAGDSSMTVKVVGTNISSSVSVTGKFVLKGVPAGNITLEFTAAGVSAHLNVRLAEQEQIDIKVNVQSTFAVIESSIRIEVDDEIEIEGEVEQVSGTCPSLVVVVHGTALALNASTQAACNDIRVGIRIKIKGDRSSGSTVIVRVDVDGRGSSTDDDQDDDEDDNDDDEDDDDHGNSGPGSDDDDED